MQSHTSTYFTRDPLVVFGATGLLSSDFIFMACVERFSPHVVLQGSDERRLQGLKDELDEAGFEGLRITTTTDIREAAAYGGYALYARSIRAAKQTREEMLIDNAPMAREVGEAIRESGATYHRVVCVSNPSDLVGLTLLVHSGLPTDAVISLSALDTLRFRRALRRRFGVDSDALTEVYTLGSHDQSMAVMLDMARVHGHTLSDMGLSADDRSAIEREVRHGGISIFKLRGHTSYQSPAVLCLRMLEATDAVPFIYPSARYHHSRRYPFTFGSLPTVIDSSGCRHCPIALSVQDLGRLDTAFGSIAGQRDILIGHGILPPTDEWASHLRQSDELVTSL